MKIAFDLSSVLWSGLLVGKDVEGKSVNFEDKDHWINSANYGYENVINVMVSAMKQFNLQPIDCLIVPEGINSKSRRLMIDNKYKSGRGNRPPEAYAEFNALKGRIIQLWRSLGAIAVVQDNVEADDTLAWLAGNIREDLTIVTNDNDLSVLNGKNRHNATVLVRVNGVLGENKYGPFNTKYLTVYKALVGDSSDTVSGIPGFGPAAWLTLHSRFGDTGLDEMARLAEMGSLLELEADAEKDPFIKKIFDGREHFIRSYRLVKLYPEWVNTLSNQLTWLPGFVHGRISDSRLASYSASVRLISADNWEAFAKWAPGEIAKRPSFALDIETSTPPESDDWLFAQGKEDGVDVMGSFLVGMSLTFGSNMQFTVYISVDHAETANVPKEALRDWLAAIPQHKQIVIHNTAFEGPVLFNEFGEHWKDNGYQGFLPNWLDTKFEASYVDENNPLGLKYLSKNWFGYDQVDYKTVTTLEVPAGSACIGRFHATVVKEITPAVYTEVDDVEVLQTPAVTETVDLYRCKMHELSAAHVMAYACDDTATTAGLHNFFKFFMELEGTYGVYLDVEIDASYLHAQSFITGVHVDLVKLRELVVEDGKVFDENKVVVDKYLVEQGADGTICPVYTEVTAAAIKYAYQLVTGLELKTAVRTPAKLIAMFAEEQPTLAGACTEVGTLNQLVKSLFKGAPTLNTGSPLQLQKLFYTTMGLPIRVYNKPTEKMREAGLRVGTPKTDNLAIEMALRDCSEEVGSVLRALRLMKMVETRRGLYYNTYGNFVHWKTGKVHSSHNQCATNTRRASSSGPNLQQVSKSVKIEGYSPRVRELILPHKKNALIVSMDFMSQELRVIADYSRDTNMLACFIGDNLKDMHVLTGVEIAQRVEPSANWTYEALVKAYEDKNNPKHKFAKECRTLGKKTNFTTEYGARAPKLAETLMVTEHDAQIYIDAKEMAFPGASAWKASVVQEAKSLGLVKTKMGAVRHLQPLMTSSDSFTVMKAERQAVNYKIQSSSAEMTKRAEGTAWKAQLEQKFDAKILAAIHDEVIASVTLEDLEKFLPEMHRCMVQPYGDMYVPIGSSISFGPNLGVQIEAGELPTGPKISSAIAEYRKLIESSQI